MQGIDERLIRLTFAVSLVVAMFLLPFSFFFSFPPPTFSWKKRRFSPPLTPQLSTMRHTRLKGTVRNRDHVIGWGDQRGYHSFPVSLEFDSEARQRTGRSEDEEEEGKRSNGMIQGDSQPIPFGLPFVTLTYCDTLENRAREERRERKKRWCNSSSGSKRELLLPPAFASFSLPLFLSSLFLLSGRGYGTLTCVTHSHCPFLSFLNPHCSRIGNGTAMSKLSLLQKRTVMSGIEESKKSAGKNERKTLETRVRMPATDTRPPVTIPANKFLISSPSFRVFQSYCSVLYSCLDLVLWSFFRSKRIKEVRGTRHTYTFSAFSIQEKKLTQRYTLHSFLPSARHF